MEGLYGTHSRETEKTRHLAGGGEGVAEPVPQVEAREAVEASCLTKTLAAVGRRERGGPNFRSDETEHGAELWRVKGINALQ